jgi:hypothetical protein
MYQNKGKYGMENRKLVKERGSLIIEAAFIMPFLFCVFLFCIYFADYIFVRGSLQSYTTHYGISAAYNIQNIQKTAITLDKNQNAIYSTAIPEVNPYQNLLDMITDATNSTGCSPAPAQNPGRTLQNMNLAQIKYNAQQEMLKSAKSASFFNQISKLTPSVQYCPGLFYSNIKTSLNVNMNIEFPAGNLIFSQGLNAGQTSYNLTPISTNTEFATMIDYVNDLISINFGDFIQNGNEAVQLVNKSIKSLEKTLCTLHIVSRGCP